MEPKENSDQGHTGCFGAGNPLTEVFFVITHGHAANKEIP